MSTTAKVILQSCVDCTCQPVSGRKGIFVEHDGYPSVAGSAIASAIASGKLDGEADFIDALADEINYGGCSTETFSHESIADHATDFTYSVCKTPDGWVLAQVRDSMGRIITPSDTRHGKWVKANLSTVFTGNLDVWTTPLTQNSAMPERSVTDAEYA